MRSLYFIPLLFFHVFVANAANISGKVTDSETKESIPGANIVIKNTLTGTITDLDGNYSIEAQKGDTLVFSYLGYVTQNVAVGNETVINVELVSDLVSLDEVVVTALGIKREEKALGYATQKVEGDDIANSNELDVINALSGKVSGVNITQGGGNVGGGGSRIVIRGETSLAGNNDPLYIIDGVPGSANSVASNDIESISVLKGPAAAALYGAQAGAGVVMITTKSGKGTEGTRVEFNSTLTWQNPLVLPEYQNKFGQGKSGLYEYYDGNNNGVEDDTDQNWGPEFDGELRPQFTGLKPWVAYPDNVSDYYETGHIYNNNIAVSSSNEKGNYRFSYTNTHQKGMLPNTGLTENRFDISGAYTVFEKIKINANIKYRDTDCDNNRGEDVRYIPRNVDMNALKDYWVPGLEGEQQYSWRGKSKNPYFISNEELNGYALNRTIVNLSLNYQISPTLSFTGRYGGDFYSRESTRKYAKSTISKESGSYSLEKTRETKRNADFLITYDKTILDAVSAKVSFGGNHYHKEFSRLANNISGLVYADIFAIQNRTKDPVKLESYRSTIERNSLYGFVNLGYNSMVYLDFTGRQDWSTTMHANNNTFFYPSVALSAIMSKILPLPKEVSFWKIRASWADVGKDFTTPYFATPNKYVWHVNKETGAAYINEILTKTDDGIKPERTRGWEAGTDLRLLDNRIGLDVTYYSSISYNQILSFVTSKAGGGYGDRVINSGEIKNSGIEIMINATPVKMKDFSWDAQLNWSKDKTAINSLIDSLPKLDKTQGVTDHLFLYDVNGERRGTFFGKGYERNENGDILFSLSGDTRRGDKKILGNYNPDWILSFSNTFTYKNFSLYALFDYRHGGELYNAVKRKLNMNGLSKDSGMNDRTGIVPDGYVEDGENGYRKLTLADLEAAGKLGGMSGQEFWANMMDEEIPESVIEDATYLKLREVKLTYNMPVQWFENNFIQSASISAVGRNLYVWTKVSHIDPEIFNDAKDRNDFGSSTKVPGYAKTSGVPSYRSYGFTLKMVF